MEFGGHRKTEKGEQGIEECTDQSQNSAMGLKEAFPGFILGLGTSR